MIPAGPDGPHARTDPAVVGPPRKSSYCGPGGCVWAQLAGAHVLLMTAPDADNGLIFTTGEWDAFLAGVRNGEFDRDALAVDRQEGVADD